MSDLIHPVTEGSFKTEVLDSRTPVLVDFWAEWCGPCLALGPTLEEVAKERQGKIKICKVNIEESPALAAQFNVRNIPFMAFIKDGQKVADLIGNHPKHTILKAVDAVATA